MRIAFWSSLEHRSRRGSTVASDRLAAPQRWNSSQAHRCGSYHLSRSSPHLLDGSWMVGTAGSALHHSISRTSVPTTRTAHLRRKSYAGNASATGTTRGSAVAGSLLPTIQNGPQLTAWNAVDLDTSRPSAPSCLFPASHAITAPFMEGLGASGNSMWMKKEG